MQMAMASPLFVVLALTLLLLFPTTPNADTSFQLHQFSTSSPAISVLGDARIYINDLALELTNTSSGRATYASPVRLLSSSPGTSISFSTTFIFSIENPASPPLSYGAGLTFHMSSENRTVGNTSSSLGLNPSSSPSHKYFAVEFDTHQDPEVQDMNDNHIGIDINSFVSQHALPAQWGSVPVTLASGNHIQAYVSYDSVERVLDVSISPYLENDYVKPEQSLLSVSVDLGGVLEEFMYVGFSAATGAGVVRHKIWSWTFQTTTVNGTGQEVASPPDAGMWSGAPSPSGGGYQLGDSGRAARGARGAVATGLGLLVGVLGGWCW